MVLTPAARVKARRHKRLFYQRLRYGQVRALLSALRLALRTRPDL